METVVSITAADVDNLAQEMAEREYGDSDTPDLPALRRAAADFFERAITSMCNDPTWCYRNFRAEWDDAIDRALKTPA